MGCAGVKSITAVRSGRPDFLHGVVRLATFTYRRQLYLRGGFIVPEGEAGGYLFEGELGYPGKKISEIMLKKYIVSCKGDSALLVGVLDENLNPIILTYCYGYIEVEPETAIRIAKFEPPITEAKMPFKFYIQRFTYTPQIQVHVYGFANYEED